MIYILYDICFAYDIRCAYEVERDIIPYLLANISYGFAVYHISSEIYHMTESYIIDISVLL